MTHFPNPGFDPHAEAIDGPTPDPWSHVRPTVDDTHNPPSRPVRVEPIIGERVLPADPHGYIYLLKVAGWVGLTVAIVLLSFALGWMTHLMVVAP